MLETFGGGLYPEVGETGLDKDKKKVLMWRRTGLENLSYVTLYYFLS